MTTPWTTRPHGAARSSLGKPSPIEISRFGGAWERSTRGTAERCLGRATAALLAADRAGRIFDDGAGRRFRRRQE